eukprot:TRINITY_DN3286_c0_g1_i1.p1 TRINITY_DN3286_c0_g1~~TRINITY_DN3286_c0_g1_i1.p1  ORF type:complete len:354 (+),score=103.63 TRINITY_DN3286_c0_g1_i1:98-1063(+)
MRSAGALALSVFVGCASGGSPTTGGPPGGYERYTVALEWQPTFSRGFCHDQTWRHVSGSYSEKHLVSHGLWPNFITTKHKGAPYPQFCKRSSSEDYTKCQSGGPSYCHPSSATLDKYNTSSEWQTYAPEYAYGGLADHEWSKHGSCTPWSQDGYFSRLADVHAKLIQGKGPTLLTNNIGKHLSYAEISGAFKSDFGGKAPEINCKSCALSEVRMNFDAVPGSLEVDLSKPVADTGGDSCSRCSSVLIYKWPGGCDGPNPPPPPPPTPSPAPANKCVQGQRGPECQYDPSTSGTSKDPCLKYQGCKRCAKASHDGTHYCTTQ